MRTTFVTILILVFSGELFAQPEARLDPLDSSYHHDKWGISPSDQIKHFRAFTTSFDGPDDDDADGKSDTWAIPEWVAYEMHSWAGHAPYEKRPSTWMTDKTLYTAGIAPDDSSYAGSGYDRGHMCMREHGRRLGKDADWNTHNVLNACPQLHAFNAGIWLGLENHCGNWADGYGKIWVICGPIVKNSSGHFTPSKWIGNGSEKKVAIPNSFFKIVIREGKPSKLPIVLAFIYPHDASLSRSAVSVDHTPYLRSVDEVEAATGLDFFTALSTTDQNAIERTKASSIWPSFSSAPAHAEMLAQRAPVTQEMTFLLTDDPHEELEKLAIPSTPCLQSNWCCKPKRWWKRCCR